MANYGFRPSSIPDDPPRQGGQQRYPNPVPENWYEGIIIDSKWVPNKKKNGEFIEFTFRITAPAYVGRTVKERFNLKNPNNQCVEIAERELKRLAVSTGWDREFDDTACLHNRPFEFYVEVQGKWNNVTGYRSISPIIDPDGTAGGNPFEGDTPFKGEGIKQSAVGWEH